MLNQTGRRLCPALRVELGRRVSQDRGPGTDEERSEEGVRQVVVVLEDDQNDVSGLSARVPKERTVPGGPVRQCSVVYRDFLGFADEREHDAGRIPAFQGPQALEDRAARERSARCIQSTGRCRLGAAGSRG
jgi:hypothetical protein